MSNIEVVSLRNQSRVTTTVGDRRYRCDEGISYCKGLTEKGTILKGYFLDCLLIFFRTEMDSCWMVFAWVMGKASLVCGFSLIGNWKVLENMYVIWLGLIVKLYNNENTAKELRLKMKQMRRKRTKSAKMKTSYCNSWCLWFQSSQQITKMFLQQTY